VRNDARRRLPRAGREILEANRDMLELAAHAGFGETAGYRKGAK
jgi:hypothetical protein